MDRKTKQTPIVGYTTAPECYDGFGTETLDAVAGVDDRGLVLRKVAIRPEHYEWQTGRYGSGLHAFATEAEAARFPQIYRLAEA